MYRYGDDDGWGNFCLIIAVEGVQLLLRSFIYVISYCFRFSRIAFLLLFLRQVYRMMNCFHFAELKQPPAYVCKSLLTTSLSLAAF